MADPLGVTASITAVLQLSRTVLRYSVDVKDVCADHKCPIREISPIRGIPSTLNETVDGARVSDEAWSMTIRSLEDLDGPLNVLRTTLTQLATTLEGSASATASKGLRTHFDDHLSRAKWRRSLGSNVRNLRCL